jgi:hypothetical protein
MKRLIAALAVAAALVIPASVTAAPPPSGGYHQPGYDQAIDNTQCADHGAFGYFGTYGGPRHDLGQGNPNGPGADGQATGDANSNLCGNPQND